MKTIDLSHLITADMPVYPGTPQPEMRQASTLAENGFAEKKITFHSHIGTHIDAQAHILKAKPTLDQLSIDQFVGTGICLPVKQPTITAAMVEEQLATHQDIDFVLFNTGWSKHWGKDFYFSNYPTLSKDAARLLTTRGLKGVGFDTISADNNDSASLPIHNILLEVMIIIENLTNLEKLSGQTFLFSCLPLNIKDADGSPVRAVGILTA